MRRIWFWRCCLLVVAPVFLFPLGCAGPGPVLFPVSPLETRDGGDQRFYDTDADGRADFAMILGGDGRVRQLQYDIDGDASGASDSTAPGGSRIADASDTDGSSVVFLDRIAAADRPHLVIILDSVPFTMVRDLWRQGRFRLFHPPSRVVAPFPVMTDLSLSEFFGASPSPGVESEYYDGHHLTNGYLSYAGGRNTGWLKSVDYHLDPVAHGEAYGHPYVWFDHELRQIQNLFQQRCGTGFQPVQNEGSDHDAHETQDSPTCFVGYCVGPSGLGAKFGRDGHQAGLVRLDRFCQQVFYQARGKVQITLLSDHGHNLMRSRRIPLSEFLGRCGYRVTDSLERPGDVVVPEFGVVTCAAIHTGQPASVARDALGLEGIDLVAYIDRGRGRPGSQEDRILVLSRSGQAVITHSNAGYRYETTSGDPLRLEPVLALLKKQGLVDADGFADDRALFAATVDGAYPDAVHRLWRAFHGLVRHTPDVLVSVKDGWHCGSAFMTDVLDLAAAHGNLGPLSSVGFVMSTADNLPPAGRMEDLHQALVKIGVPFSTKTEKK